VIAITSDKWQVAIENRYIVSGSYEKTIAVLWDIPDKKFFFIEQTPTQNQPTAKIVLLIIGLYNSLIRPLLLALFKGLILLLILFRPSRNSSYDRSRNWWYRVSNTWYHE